jgi:prolyl 4-hydroxylase
MRCAILLVPISILVLGILHQQQFGFEYAASIFTQKLLNPFSSKTFDPEHYSCDQSYTIELLSIDPLVIYINNFLSDEEIDHLLDMG